MKSVFIALILTGAGTCFADSPYLHLLEPNIGNVVVPRGSLVAWDAPPTGFTINWSWWHEQVKTVHARERYVVVDVRVVRSLLLVERFYLRLESADIEDDPCNESPCWVYQGNENSDLPPNLLPESSDRADLTE